MALSELKLAQQHIAQALQLLMNAHRSRGPYGMVSSAMQRQLVMGARMIQKSKLLLDESLKTIGCEGIEEDDGSF